MAGTSKVEIGKRGQINSPRVVVVDWIGDSVDGTVPDIAVPEMFGKLVRVATIPGADVAPDAYDIAIKDSDGIDLLAGEGSGRSATDPGHLLFAYPPAVNSTLTIAIANQDSPRATGKIKLYIDSDDK